MSRTWVDDLPDVMLVAEPADAVRLLDAAPELSRSIYTGPVGKPGTALVIDVKAILELPTDGFLKDLRA